MISRRAPVRFGRLLALVLASSPGMLFLETANAAEEPETAATPPTGANSMQVQLGIDNLASGGFSQLAGLRVGLLANDASRDSSGRRTIDVLATAAAVHLVTLFTPEHGLKADRDGNIPSGRDERTGLAVHSLYGARRRPSASMLAGLDAIVVDLQDVGVRFYTYATTVGYLMEAAAERKLRIVILDRPNPIGAAGVRGPSLEPALRSFTGYFPMPLQHGMTLAELALMFNSEMHIGADLVVIKSPNYRRTAWFDETGLAWINPSPNLRSLSAAVLYPGVALIEGTNVSVGRGTPAPFELVGAPWVDGPALARRLEQRGIHGVSFRPESFTPASDRYATKPCQGIRIMLTDRSVLDAPRLGVELAAALRHLHPQQFKVRDMLALLGSRSTLSAIEAGEDPSAIERHWQDGLRAFGAIRNRYLLY